MAVFDVVPFFSSDEIQAASGQPAGVLPDRADIRHVSRGSQSTNETLVWTDRIDELYINLHAS